MNECTDAKIKIENEQDRRKEWLIGIVWLLVVTIILGIRSFYSFCWSDESFYMSGVHRLYLGAVPVVDEYHPTQFYSVLLLPFYSLFRLIKGSTDGIYLVARMFYLVLSFIVSLYVFYFMKKKEHVSFYISIFAGTLIMLYSRANIYGPSYHNIFLLTFVSSAFLIMQVIQDKENGPLTKNQAVLALLAGSLMGMAIITIPILVAFYILVSFVLLVIMIRSKKLSGNYRLPVICFWGGTLIIGGLYLIFIFSRTSLSEFTQSIPYLFMDSVHESRTLAAHINDIILLCTSYAKYSVVSLTLAGAYRIVCFAIKNKNEKYKGIFLSIGFISLGIDLCQRDDSHMGSYVAFLFFELLFVILYGKTTELRLIKKAYSQFFIFGAIIVCLMYSLASATSDPIIQGMIFISLGLLITISDIQKNVGKDRYRTVILVAAMFLMIGMTMRIRIVSVYRDAPLQKLDSRISEGPAEGLITTKDNYEAYNRCLNTMKAINAQKSDGRDTIFITAVAPWMYTCTDIPCGVQTTWRTLFDYPLIEKYFESHDLSDLKYVLILDEEYGSYEYAMDPEGTDEHPNINQYSGYLWNAINTYEYKKQKVACGILYVRDN